MLEAAPGEKDQIIYKWHMLNEIIKCFMQNLTCKTKTMYPLQIRKAVNNTVECILKVVAYHFKW